MNKDESTERDECCGLWVVSRSQIFKKWGRLFLKLGTAVPILVTWRYFLCRFQHFECTAYHKLSCKYDPLKVKIKISYCIATDHDSLAWPRPWYATDSSCIPNPVTWPRLESVAHLKIQWLNFWSWFIDIATATNNCLPAHQAQSSWVIDKVIEGLAIKGFNTFISGCRGGSDLIFQIAKCDSIGIW